MGLQLKGDPEEIDKILKSSENVSVSELTAPY